METIGGYRIIRKLGSGSRSDVFLGHAEHAEHPDDRLAAIKLYRADVSAERIDTEIAALSSLDGPHIVRLRDLASSEHGRPCLILQRLDPAGLADLLSKRSAILAGEAVTILVPIADAVSFLHRHGVVHGALTASAVLFDDAGAPVLTGFGAAGFVTAEARDVTPAAREAHAGAVHDLQCLRALAGTVLDRVSAPEREVENLRRWLRHSSAPGVEGAGEHLSAESFGAELASRLFALADPLPIGFTAEPEARPPLPRRWGAADGGSMPEGTERPVGTSAPGMQVLGALPASIRRALARLLDAVREVRVKMQESTRSVRRRVWVVAALGGLALITAIMLVPVGTGRGEPPLPSAEPVSSAEPEVMAPAMASDDPLVAVTALLGTRAGCLSDRSVLCLDAVDEAGSPAWVADAARIRAAQDGAELTTDAFDTASVPVLIERLGASAIVGLVPSSATETSNAANTTASVLMIRTEAGWRLRSLLLGEARVG